MDPDQQIASEGSLDGAHAAPVGAWRIVAATHPLARTSASASITRFVGSSPWKKFVLRFRKPKTVVRKTLVSACAPMRRSPAPGVAREGGGRGPCRPPAGSCKRWCCWPTELLVVVRGVERDLLDRARHRCCGRRVSEARGAFGGGLVSRLYRGKWMRHSAATIPVRPGKLLCFPPWRRSSVGASSS
jgi:hypothetical protein